MAVDRHEDLEIALAEAKAALIKSVTDASKVESNRADAAAKVKAARARCRQLYTALAGPGHSGFITRSRKRVS
mgnify:CR=1 FL=1